MVWLPCETLISNDFFLSVDSIPVAFWLHLDRPRRSASLSRLVLQTSSQLLPQTGRSSNRRRYVCFPLHQFRLEESLETHLSLCTAQARRNLVRLLHRITISRSFYEANKNRSALTFSTLFQSKVSSPIPVMTSTSCFQY